MQQSSKYSKNSFQSKIDNLIKDANRKMSTPEKNELSALISYSQSIDLFDFLNKYYPIQLHEIQVKISFCWENLGNIKESLNYLNKAMKIIPNIPTLMLFKSVLLQSLNQTDESQKCLLKYKQLVGNNLKHNFHYDTFRLIYYYILEYEEDILLREIDDYLIKYKELADKIVAIYYIRAQLFSNLSIKYKSDEKRKKHFISKYEENIMKANHIRTSDINYLINEGICNENITKIFFMIRPEINNFKPKPLIEYHRNISDLGVFYIIFKAIKLFKIKLEKKKIMEFYINQIKYYQLNQNTISNCYNVNNSFTETKGNTNDDNSLQQRDKIKTIMTENNDNLYGNLEEIQREYQNSVRKLYRSVWVSENKLFDIQTLSKEKFLGNYFIIKGYYSNENLNPLIFKYLSQNKEYNNKNKKKEKFNIKISKIGHGIKGVKIFSKKSNKTPVRLNTNRRFKIQSSTSNNNANGRSQVDSNSKKDLSNKSSNLLTNSKYKKIIRNEDSCSSLSNGNRMKNYKKNKLIKFSNGTLFQETTTLGETNRKKTIQFSNLNTINIKISHCSKSKEKLKNFQKNKNQLLYKKISFYNMKNLVNKGKNIGRYLINSFSTKSNIYRRAFKTSAVNKSEESWHNSHHSLKNFIKGNNIVNTNSNYTIKTSENV